MPLLEIVILRYTILMALATVLRWRYRIWLVLVLVTLGAVAFEWQHLRFARAQVQGVTVGSRRHQTEMVLALNKMDFRPVVDAIYPMERIVDAFHVQEGGHHFGKICIAI